MTPTLRNLTIKPVLACTQNCPYCSGRQQLFRKSRDASLALEDWARVFSQADDLGCNYLDISGGEPTLYRELPSLVWEAKRRGWYASVNTTGVRLAGLLEPLGGYREIVDQVDEGFNGFHGLVGLAENCAPHQVLDAFTVSGVVPGPDPIGQGAGLAQFLGEVL